MYKKLTLYKCPTCGQLREGICWTCVDDLGD